MIAQSILHGAIRIHKLIIFCVPPPQKKTRSEISFHRYTFLTRQPRQLQLIFTKGVERAA